MKAPKHVYLLCPACDACPTVEIYDDGRVTIGESPNLVTLGREEWNELVRGIKAGALAEI
ncbi:MAG: hypothetical protein ACREMJ_11160 [Gemmatimonadales bacterium]